MLLAGACSLASAKWSWDTGTKAIEPAGGGGGCLTADGAQPNNELLLRPCNKTDPNQQWAAAQGTVVLAGSPHLGWVSEQNTDAGKRVWLYDLGAGPSHNAYCVAHHNCAFSFDRATGRFTNSAKNCAVMAPAGPPPPPPAPPAPPAGPTMHTCAPGSPVEHERFCDASLSFEERAAALVSNLTLAEKLDLWTVNEMKLNIPRLNIKGFEWQHLHPRRAVRGRDGRPACDQPGGDVRHGAGGGDEQCHRGRDARSQPRVVPAEQRPDHGVSRTMMAITAA